MRVTAMVAALALVLGACAGGDDAETSNVATDTTSAPAATAPSTGTTHDVDMTMVDGQPRFVPENLTVGPNDVIRFHNKEGGPHNVKFWADSMPANAASTISIDRTMGPLESELLVEMGAVVTVSLANAPAGEYPMTCVPHQAMGMNGKITVQ